MAERRTTRDGVPGKIVHVAPKKGYDRFDQTGIRTIRRRSGDVMGEHKVSEKQIRRGTLQESREHSWLTHKQAERVALDHLAEHKRMYLK